MIAREHRISERMEDEVNVCSSVAWGSRQPWRAHCRRAQLRDYNEEASSLHALNDVEAGSLRLLANG
jgi:hypothetical protein